MYRPILRGLFKAPDRLVDHMIIWYAGIGAAPSWLLTPNFETGEVAWEYFDFKRHLRQSQELTRQSQELKKALVEKKDALKSHFALQVSIPKSQRLLDRYIAELKKIDEELADEPDDNLTPIDISAIARQKERRHDCERNIEFARNLLDKDREMLAHYEKELADADARIREINAARAKLTGKNQPIFARSLDGPKRGLR